MNPIPEASAAIRAEIIDWLERFSVCVREVDYATARPFWHPDILAFGTFQRVLQGLDDWGVRQWDNVWPRTADFTFVTAETRVLASGDGAMAVAIAPWTSTGFHKDGSTFDRPGRATIVLAKQPGGNWVGIHSHMSLNRGVPDDSHGNRPVKAR